MLEANSQADRNDVSYDEHCAKCRDRSQYCNGRHGESYGTKIGVS